MPILRSNDFHSNNLLPGKRMDRTKKNLRILMQIPSDRPPSAKTGLLLFAEIYQVAASSIIICVAQLYSSCCQIRVCLVRCLHSSFSEQMLVGCYKEQPKFRDAKTTTRYIKRKNKNKTTLLKRVVGTVYYPSSEITVTKSFYTAQVENI